jgi:uncharacterized membrane protein (UPF0182 family)
MRKRGLWLQLALGLLLVALFVGRWLAVSTAGRLWAEALGVGTPHADIAALRLALSAAGFVLAAVWCIGNVLLVYRQIGSVQVPRRLGNLEIAESVPRRYLLLGAVAIGAVLALALSRDTGGWWLQRALVESGVVVGVQDPVLHHDAGFYLFRLPWSRAEHGYVLLLVGVVLGMVALLYGAIGAVRWAERRLVYTDLARRHLAVLLAALALVLVWGYRLEPAELVGGLGNVPYDAILSDVRIPVAHVLAVLALLVAAASVLWLVVERGGVVGIAWLTLLLTSFVGHYVLPGFVAAARGAEGRRAAELEAAAAAFTRDAFALATDTVRLQLAVPDDGFVTRHAATLAHAPVWEAFAASQVLRLADVRAAPDPRSADVVLETSLAAYPDARGRIVPVLLGVRETDTARARAVDRDLSWERRHGEPFGSCVGAVAIAAAAATDDGLPLYVPQLERPDSQVATPADLALRNDTIWFGPGFSDFAISPPDHLAGIAAGGLWRRLALAWTLQAPRLLTSSSIGRSTLVLTDRAVGARLARFAPFARFGPAYPVVADGALLWLAPGYVWADAYPLSQRVGWRGEGIRYLQASLIGVVDAHSGATELFLLPDADPLARAWAELLPGLVRPPQAIAPEVLRHVRYPDELFERQVALLRAQPGRARPAEPFWWVGPAPGDSVSRLRLRAVDDVLLEPRVAAVLDGTMRQGSRRLTVLTYPQPYVLPGPSELAREFRVEPTAGAAIEGTVRLVPFSDGAVALQAFYADSGTLATVALGWRGSVGRGRSLAEAMGQVRPVAPPSAALEPGDALTAARQAFRRLDSARAAGDWKAFGEAWDGLRRALVRGRDSTP